MGVRYLLGAAIGLAMGSAALAQSGSPGDMTPNGPFNGTLPNKDVTETNAAVRHSATDVTAQRNRNSVGLAGIHATAEQRKQDAITLAEKVRKGAVVPDNYAKPLQEALDGDLKLWREEYQVSSKDYRTAKNTWLKSDKPLTASEWAVRRSDWFAERDRWIAASKGSDPAKSNN